MLRNADAGKRDKKMSFTGSQRCHGQRPAAKNVVKGKTMQNNAQQY